MPLFCFRNDGQRLLPQPGRPEHLQNLLHVVAVNDFRAPVERLKPLAINLHVMPKRRRLALTKAIHIDDRDQIAQLIDPGEGSGLPNRTLGAFAIAHQDVGPVIEVVQSGAQRHAHPHAQTLAQRAGGDIDKGKTRGRVPFQVAAQFAQGGQVLPREQTQLRPNGVQQRRRVAFRENQAVVVRVTRVFWIKPHVAKEQRGGQIRGRTAGTGMAAASGGGGGNGIDAQLIRQPR